MLEPIALDNTRFTESNSEEFILIEHNHHSDGYGFSEPPEWLSASFIHHTDVMKLAKWLLDWNEKRLGYKIQRDEVDDLARNS